MVERIEERDWPGGAYRFLVTGPARYDQVDAFQQEVYRARYGVLPADGLDPGADFLVALDQNGDLVGSVRVLRSDAGPFSFDGMLDVGRVVGLGARPAEIGRWCVRDDVRSLAQSKGLHFGMMKLIYSYARSRGITDYLICVYPELVTFYRGLYFQDTGHSFSHADWGVVRMFVLTISKLEERLRRQGGRLAGFVLSDLESNFSLTGE